MSQEIQESINFISSYIQGAKPETGAQAIKAFNSLDMISRHIHQLEQQQKEAKKPEEK